MRFPRLTTRRLMALVAVAGVLFEAERLLRWRAYCLQRVEIEADRARDLVTGEICLRPQYDTPAGKIKLHAHYVALARKYRHAARCPWLPVAPDASPPE